MLDPVWQVGVDCATPGEWSSLLSLFRDGNIYQTWSYGAVRWGRENLSHLILKRDGEVVGVAQLRILRPTRLKLGVAYLRWGPLFQRRGAELDVQTVSRLARALEQEYASRRGLLLQIIPNAFLGSHRAALFESAFLRFTPAPRSARAYRTFVLDLRLPIEQLRRNLDKKWRNQLTRSEKNGLKILAGTATDQYRIFAGMYDQMKRRKSFHSNVNIEEFGRMQESLPDAHRMRVLICEQQGRPVAGLVASAIGDSAIYLLGATSDDGLYAKGAYLLQWTLIQWLKDNGFEWYDLGGINPEVNPGVYSFKRGLSGEDVSQLSPLVACNSVISSLIVRATLTAHRVVSNLNLSQLGGFAKATT